MQYEFVFSSAVDSQTSVISDQIIRRIEEASIEKYPDELRMVVYEDFATGNVYRFITNHTGYEALTTAELYGVIQFTLQVVFWLPGVLQGSF